MPYGLPDVGGSFSVTGGLRVVGYEDTKRLLDELPTQAEKAMARRLLRAGMLFADSIKLHASRKTLRQDRGGPTGTGTGKLAQSWSGNELRRLSNSELAVVISSSSPYARIHETGGPIVPRRAQALTIPLTWEAARKRASDFQDLFVLKLGKDEEGGGENGRAFLARKRPGPGGEDQVELLYLLSRGVTIPARRYISNAYREVREKIQATLEGALDQVARTGRSGGD